MVIGTSIETIIDIVLVIGTPVLFVLFYFEGLIIGKILQPAAVFVGVIAITNPQSITLGVVLLGCTAAVTFGQWSIYHSVDPDASDVVGIRDKIPYLNRLPTVISDRIGENRLRVVDRLLSNYGSIGLFISTFLPGIRGIMAIPAGMSSFPVLRFIGITAVANLLYFVILILVARGILGLVS